MAGALLFQNNVVRHDDDAVFGDVEAFGVLFEVGADVEVCGDLDAVFDDGPFDGGAGADLHPVPEDGLLDQGVAADPDPGGEHCPVHRALDDAARGDEGVAHGQALAGRDVFAGGIELRPAAQGPVPVEELEGGFRAQQVGVGLEIGVQQADVPPVERRPVGVGEIIGKDLFAPHCLGDDVGAEVVLAGLLFGVLDDLLHQGPRPEDVDPHGGQGIVGHAGHPRGPGGLLQKILHRALGVHLEDAEGTGLLPGHRHRGHGHVGVAGEMEIQHLPVVHLIDVVAGEDQDLLGTLALQQGEVLVDGVGGAPVPAADHDLLGRHGIDELPQVRMHDVPGGPEVLVQGETAVLGEDVDAPDAGVDTVGQGEIDDPIEAAEGDGRLGLVPGQGKEALALAAGHDDGGEVLEDVHHSLSNALTLALSSLRSEDLTT